MSLGRSFSKQRYSSRGTRSLPEGPSLIAESGSIGDYINSIMRLEARKISEIYPGHGKISKTPEEDFSQAILNAKKLLCGDQNLSVSPFRPPLEAEEALGSG